MPLRRAFFNFLIPLQIGARDVAFPRLNALQLLGLPLRRALHERRASCSARAPDGGWFGYAPLTDATVLARPEHRLLGARPPDPRRRLDRRRRSTSSSTIINMRAPGMKLDAHADVHLDGARHAVPADRSPSRSITVALCPAACSTASSARNFYDACRRRRPAPLAAPVLGLRPPRGLHPDPAGVRASSPRSSRRSRASRSSATRSWSTRASLIAFLGFGVWAHHMFAVGHGPDRRLGLRRHARC